MKITTWNVSGLRAWLKKEQDAWHWVREFDPDVICLQEVKARPEQLTAEQLARFAGYQVCWNPAERPGYSGVLTLVKNLPARLEKDLGIPEYDGEGRVVKAWLGDFLLYNIYFPNGGRDHLRVPYKLGFYAALLEQCDELHRQGQKIIITGDINTCHQEIDLARPRENRNTTGFLPEERAWISTYLEHGFVDVYRHLYPSRVQYTWWDLVTRARARNVGWRLDYFLVSGALVPRVQDVIIHDEVLGSDHCPVTLVID